MVCLHTATMGVHPACFFTDRVEKDATLAWNRAGKQSSYLVHSSLYCAPTGERQEIIAAWWKTTKEAWRSRSGTLMEENWRAMDINTAGWDKSRKSPRRRGILPAPCLVRVIAALAVLPGCDSTSFVPSRPPELSGSPTAAARTSGAALSPSVPPATTTPAAAAGAKSPATPTVRARLVELILARPACLDRA